MKGHIRRRDYSADDSTSPGIGVQFVSLLFLLFSSPPLLLLLMYFVSCVFSPLFPVFHYEEMWREGPNFVKLAGLLTGVCLLFFFFFLAGSWLSFWFDLFLAWAFFRRDMTDRRERERERDTIHNHHSAKTLGSIVRSVLSYRCLCFFFFFLIFVCFLGV